MTTRPEEDPRSRSSPLAPLAGATVVPEADGRHDGGQAESHARNSLAVSEIRYRRLFETARDGILIIDAGSGQIIDANPFMMELLGYSLDEFLGRELWQIGLFQDKAMNLRAFQELQLHGYIRYEHLPLRTKDNREAEVEFVSNVYLEDGRKVAQCNIRDITERRRLERQALELSVELADLHRRKDEFLAMLSHELRNPLAPILNAAALLRLQHNDSDTLRQVRGIIERQVGQLKHIVDDLLEISRITTGRIRLRQERIVMNNVVECALETASPQMVQQHHQVTVSLPPHPIWMYADAARLEQVVVNLLANAAKFTDEGGTIGVTLEQEGDLCVLRIRDNGVGIAPEVLPRLFDLFTQADRSLDRAQGGLGIGLALVRRLVELHRGTIEVHSSLGQGSEFIVRLPVAPAELPDPQPPAVTERGAEPSGASLRVLVVDDNVDTASSLAMVMKVFGHDSREAHDGARALEVALDYRPDAVLLDVGLPGLDGYEVARRMRGEAALRGTTLIAITGYGQDGDCDRARAAGFDHHLIKPVEPEKLEKILTTVSPNDR